MPSCPSGFLESGRAWTQLGSKAPSLGIHLEHRYVYIVQQLEHAGHAMNTLFVDDLDALVAQITGRGLDPAKRETYPNGVRKITYRDADGNEIGFGGAPL
jgi:hypothetical protein